MFIKQTPMITLTLIAFTASPFLMHVRVGQLLKAVAMFSQDICGFKQAPKLVNVGITRRELEH
jgi:hypothetical protein